SLLACSSWSMSSPPRCGFDRKRRLAGQHGHDRAVAPVPRAGPVVARPAGLARGRAELGAVVAVPALPVRRPAALLGLLDELGVSWVRGRKVRLGEALPQRVAAAVAAQQEAATGLEGHGRPPVPRRLGNSREAG